MFGKYVKNLKVSEVFFVYLSRVLLPAFCFSCVVTELERRNFKKKINFPSFCFFSSLPESDMQILFLERRVFLKKLS